MADNLGGLAAQAGAGSQSLTSAFEELLKSQMANRPTPEERQGALNTYANAITSKGDTPEEWQVLLGGRLTAENPADPFQAARAALQYKLAWDKTQRETAKKETERAAKLRYDDIIKRQDTAIGGAGMATQFAHAALNPIMNIGGVGVNRQTGRVIVPKDYTQIHSKIREDAYQAAIKEKRPNPEEYADQQADMYILRVLTNPSISGPGYAQREGQAPLPSQASSAALSSETPLVNAPAGVPALSAAPDSGVPAIISDEDTSPLTPENKRDFTFDVSGLNQGDRRMVQALIDRYRSNPNPGTEQATINEINKLLERGALQKVTPSTLQYQDTAKIKGQEAQAEAVGKDLAKEGTLLNDAMYASNKMTLQLDLLDQLYSTPNMPEGELGPLLQQLRSGLKSLGMNVGKEVGAADMARAVASNFALHLRSGDGQNLLPGQMSNYEDKLLQQMAPVLSLTNEGRLALSQFMREMAKTNARFGHEFNLMTDDRGIVSPEWRKRKERVMKEEMARIAEVNREIMSRFQGAK